MAPEGKLIEAGRAARVKDASPLSTLSAIHKGAAHR